MSEEDRAWDEYSEGFRREVLPKLLDSPISVFLGLEPDDPAVWQAAIQLGVALICGTPLLVLVLPGCTISPQLSRAADEIVDEWDPDSSESQERLRAAMRRLGVAGTDKVVLVLDAHHESGVPYYGAGNVSAFHCDTCLQRAIKAGLT